MAKKRRYGERDIEYWKKVASILAIILTLVILLSGLAGSCMSSENRTLDAYKNTNEVLRNANKTVIVELTSMRKKLKECNEENISYKVKNASVKTESEDNEEIITEITDDLQLSQDKIVKLKAEIEDLKAKLQKSSN
jgi:septal ring factor EnvC (AmiA/AmiB activator)